MTEFYWPNDDDEIFSGEFVVYAPIQPERSTDAEQPPPDEPEDAP